MTRQRGEGGGGGGARSRVGRVGKALVGEGEYDNKGVPHG